MAAEHQLTAVEGIAGHGFALQRKWLAQVRVGSKPEPLVSARTSAFASCGHAGRIAWAALCHLETHPSQQTASVFDHPVPGQVSLLAWVREPRGVDVDHQLGLGPLQKAQYGSPQERRRYVERPHVAFARPGDGLRPK
jgi:hypothetical protein